MRQCDQIKIEDILPFFPEGSYIRNSDPDPNPNPNFHTQAHVHPKGTRIDDFKEEICVSLEAQTLTCNINAYPQPVPYSKLTAGL